MNPTINYTATDMLGSPRVVTNALGNVVSRRDFMPFGEDVPVEAGNRAAVEDQLEIGVIEPGTGNLRTTALNYQASDNIRQRFTGYQKDTETSLDFAEARMYESRYGRFTAVDPLLASGKSANPQSFNRYVYCSNNPILMTDYSGLQSGKAGERQQVFLFFFLTKQERQGSTFDERAIRREASRNGVDLRIFYNPKNNNVRAGSEANYSNYTKALGTKDAVVISSGHAVGPIAKPDDNSPTGFRWYGDGLNVGDYYLRNGYVQNHEFTESWDESGLQVNAKQVIINSCDVTNFVPFLTERMNPGSSVVYNDAGPDGYSGTHTDQDISVAQTRAVIQGKDPVAAGQKVIDSPATQALVSNVTPHQRVNDGDKIRVAVAPEKKENKELAR